jgi:hypothetical protein
MLVSKIRPFGILSLVVAVVVSFCLFLVAFACFYLFLDCLFVALVRFFIVFLCFCSFGSVLSHSG